MKRILFLLTQLCTGLISADSNEGLGTSIGIGKGFADRQFEVYSGAIEYYPWKPNGTNIGFIGSGNLYFGRTGPDYDEPSMDLKGMMGASAIQRFSLGSNRMYLKSALLGITNNNPRRASDDNGKWVSFWNMGFEIGAGITVGNANAYLCRSPFDCIRLELGYFWL